MLRFKATVEKIGTKPVKVDGIVVNSEIVITMTTALDTEVLRGLADATRGKTVHVYVESGEIPLFEDGEIRGALRVAADSRSSG